MHAILSPAMAVMKRLRFGGKFALISAVFVLPIAFLLWLLVSNMNAEIAFAQKERLGVSYNRAMLSLLQHMQQHRGMASGLLNGDRSFAPRLEAMEAKIAKDADAIDALEREHGVVLATTGKWNGIKKNWLEVRSKFNGMTPPQSFAAHTAITQSILDQIAYAGDTSNLTVDPDLDSYYLMNTFISKLPDVSEAAGQARAIGTGVATRKTMEPAERANLMLLVSKSEGGYRNAMVNLDKAESRNPEVAGAVKAAKALVEATGRFVTTAREKIIDAKQIEISPADYFAVATQAIDDNFKANELVAAELDRLLVSRIQAKTLHKWQTLGVVGVVLLLASMLLAGFYRVVNDGLARAGTVAAAVAGGNLAIEIRGDGRDETAHLLDTLGTMQQELVAIVSRIRDSSEQISSASGQIAAGNADLSQRTEEQASSLEETASSMEELTSTVKQNAENALQANQLASGASTVAVRGGEVVSRVVRTMSGISESSKKIADIIGVIDGIAFQTNILALNAAVEAARAGEQGRGFAVVATEVRNLAQKSAAAAKEIKTLIGDSVAKVNDGSKLVDEAGRTMEEIVASIKRVTDIMAEITAASQEQSSGIEQVNTAITQMDQVTQQNAALVEEAAAAAESMQEQAQLLVQVVSVFKLADRGEWSAPSSTRKAVAAKPQVERRGPNRAKNVTRLPARTSTAVVPAAKAVGSDVQEWEEF